jgi:hypothetical protein
MATKEEEEAARRAADDAKMDKILSGIDSLTKRMDSMEKARDDDAKRKADEEAKRKADDDAAKKKADDDARRKADDDAARARFSRRKDDDDDKTYKDRHDAEETEAKKGFQEKGDPEQVAADRAKKARKDAEEAEEKEREAKKADDAKKKADAAAALSGVTAERLAEINAKLAQLDGKLADVPAETRTKLLEAQARADSVYAQFGLEAPRAMAGENLAEYRRRLARGLQKHSARWKDADLARMDDVTFEQVDDMIRADAAAAAANPSDLQPGELRILSRTLPSGHRIHEFRGNPDAWMAQFSGPVRQYVKKFVTPGSTAA